MDEGTEAQAAPVAPKKARRKAKKAMKAAPKAAQKSAAPSAIGVIAIYALLGILVIGTSFYTGYLFGKTGATGTQTGSVNNEKLTVIEYSDFQCPFCSRAVPTVEQLKQEYGDKVTVVYKQFPLEGLHPNAFNAAVAAECVRKAKGDDAFWTYHDTLFQNQDALDVASLKQYASAQGIDIASCLDGQETADKVRADMAEGRAAGVSGTPSFLVGDELVVGAVPYATLKAKVDAKLSGVAAPTPAPAPAPAPAPTQVENVADGNYVLGNANAKVTIVEFTDFQCPFCDRAHTQTFPQIKSNYIDTGKVRYTIRNFPLPFHENAEKSAEAAECAGKVGGNTAYWMYVDTLFSHQDALAVANLKQYAKDQGLDESKFNTCLDSGEFAKLIQDDVAWASQNGVGGTPSFYVNGKLIVGAQPYTAFQTAIDAALQ